jgi:hypothetical protein
MMPHHVHLLTDAHRDKLLRHFVQLDPEDRRLRFGTPVTDSGIQTYVEGIDFVDSDLFGVFDDKLEVVGALHLAYSDDEAEFGLSVLSRTRGQGIGNSLFERATMHLANRFVRTVYMHCLRENEVVMHLAKKHGMRIVVDGSEADAWLALPQASPGTVTAEWVASRLALLDYRQKVNARAAKTALKALTSE